MWYFHPLFPLLPAFIFPCAKFRNWYPCPFWCNRAIRLGAFFYVKRKESDSEEKKRDEGRSSRWMRFTWKMKNTRVRWYVGQRRKRWLAKFLIFENVFAKNSSDVKSGRFDAVERHVDAICSSVWYIYLPIYFLFSHKNSCRRTWTNNFRPTLALPLFLFASRQKLGRGEIGSDPRNEYLLVVGKYRPEMKVDGRKQRCFENW